MKRLSRKRLALLALPVFALFLGRTADAAPLVPGGSVVPDTISFTGAEAILASTTIFLSTPSFTGSITAAVLDEGAANPLGGLTFVYQATNDLGSATSNGREGNENFDAIFLGGLIDAHVADNGSALGIFIDGTEVPVSADWDVLGAAGFAFSGAGAPASAKIDPGETSWVLVLRTNAPSWTDGFSSLINGTSDFDVTFQPAPVVAPEPAAMILLSGGLLAFGAVIRRRRKAAAQS